MDKALRPIHHLSESIRQMFEDFTSQLSEVRKAAIGKQQIVLHLNDTELALNTPQAHLDRAIIEINVNHLSYVWTCCYLLVGLQDLYHDKEKENKSVISFDHTPTFRKLVYTFNWGRSLRDRHNEWPPQAAYPSSEGKYVIEANEFFKYAICHLMFHELGHLLLHRNTVKFIRKVNGPYYERTMDDVRRIRSMEQQADSFALDCMLSIRNDEKLVYMIGQGAFMSIFSTLYLLDSSDIRGGTHPDADERLKAVIRAIKMKEDYHNIHMELTRSIGLQLFLNITQTQFVPDDQEPNYANFVTLEADIFNLLSDLKAKYHQYRPFNYRKD